MLTVTQPARVLSWVAVTLEISRWYRCPAHLPVNKYLEKLSKCPVKPLKCPLTLLTQLTRVAVTNYLLKHEREPPGAIGAGASAPRSCG